MIPSNPRRHAAPKAGKKKHSTRVPGRPSQANVYWFLHDGHGPEDNGLGESHTAEGDASALIDIVTHPDVSECFQRALPAVINAFTEERAAKLLEKKMAEAQAKGTKVKGLRINGKGS